MKLISLLVFITSFIPIKSLQFSQLFIPNSNIGNNWTIVNKYYAEYEMLEKIIIFDTSYLFFCNNINQYNNNFWYVNIYQDNLSNIINSIYISNINLCSQLSNTNNFFINNMLEYFIGVLLFIHTLFSIYTLINCITNNENMTIKKLNKITKELNISDINPDIKVNIDNCSICIDDYKEDTKIRQLKCLHIFHKKCIDQWLLSNNKFCPYCRDIVY